MSVPEESLEPDVALDHINRAEELVRSGHRWRAKLFAGVGVWTVAYFAVMGGFDYPQSGLVNTVMLVIPVFVVLIVGRVLEKHRAVQSRRVVRWEGLLFCVYMGLYLMAFVLALHLPNGFPTALVGVIPAVPCFIGAWRAAHQ